MMQNQDRTGSAQDDQAMIASVGERLRGLMDDDELDATYRVYASMARACILQERFDLSTRARVARMLDHFDWPRGRNPTDMERAAIAPRITMLEETFQLG